VLFDIEKSLGAFVAINAKGGDCWHVLQAVYSCH
jgi:hypothetical protein